MITIYKSLIRPHLEYCVQLWSPVAKHGNWQLIMSIENVQRRFTRLIDGVGLMTYEERLKKLGLTTLLERRARGDLIETFRIVNGIANYGETLFNLSRSGARLVIRPGDGNPKKHDFLSRRVVGFWNKLPEHIKAAKTVDSFKNNLEKFKATNYKSSGQYWELSQEIFSRINDSGRDDYVDFMLDNPEVAKRKRVNIRGHI